MEIRWDTVRMAELAAGLDDRGAALMANRTAALEVWQRLGRAHIELRAIVIAALWTASGAEELWARRRLLTAAESNLLWHLGPPPPAERWRPLRRSREVDTIEAELAAEQLPLAASAPEDGRAAPRVTELLYELAVARHHQHLLDADPATAAVPSALSELIDFLGYEVVKSRPPPVSDWRRVAAAAASLHRLLDESWFGDVGRPDLLAIHELLAGLPRAELDAVLRQLSDDELYRWFHEFDGVRGGNLNEAEEAALFATLATSASAGGLFRLARAENGSRFQQIAAAVRGAAPPAVAMQFIEICAAFDGDNELIAALAGLASLDDRRRRAVVSAMRPDGTLDRLAMATEAFVARQAVTRDDAVVVEFFEGLGSAFGATASTLADLTVAGLLDRDRFRSAWSDVGGLLTLAFTDPEEFFAIVVDIETLRHNPARWTGSAAAAVATTALGKAATAGKLGNAARRTADWLDRFGGAAIVDGPGLRLRVGDLHGALDRLAGARNAAAVRDSLDELARATGYAAHLEGELGSP